MAYYLRIGDSSRRTLAALAVTDAVLSCRANGFDSLSFSRDAGLAEAPFAYGAAVELWDAETGGTRLFAGEVSEARIGGDAASGVAHSYVCSGPLARLETLQYTQAASAYDAEGQGLSPETFQEARVVLGMSGTTRRTAGGQIADILAFAINRCGLGLAVGPGVASAGSQFPLDQRENVSCWEAVVCCLRWIPGHTLWVDYSAETPTVNLTPYASLAARTVAAGGGSLRGLRATPRDDLVKPGVRIFYRKTATVDGSTREQRYVRTAGDASAADALSLYIDLEGSSRQTVSQDVVAPAYPSFASSAYSSSDTRAWVLSKVPWLADLHSWTITGISRSGSHDYPRELLSGQVAGWMSAGFETEFVTVDISYEIRDSGGNVLDNATVSVPIECASTSATTKTYRRTVSYDSGEAVPDGLESAVYAAWSIRHWDGSLETDIDRAGWLLPGMKVSVTGSSSGLASMGAVVQSSDIDLATGAETVAFGTCRGLEADSLVALYRATRGRRYAWSLNTSSSGGGDSGSVAGGHYNNAAPSPAMTRAAERIVAADQSSRTHVIDLRPAAVQFATASDASPQTVQLREVAVVVDDNGTKKAKLAQVLCGAPYGTPFDVGGGAPSDPGNAATTLGSTSEGSSAALSGIWTSGGANGLKLYVISRVVYDDTASTPHLYGYYRLITFDKSGRLYSVSAEHRYVIDQPTTLSL